MVDDGDQLRFVERYKGDNLVTPVQCDKLGGGSGLLAPSASVRSCLDPWILTHSKTHLGWGLLSSCWKRH